ncbi:MAG: small multi-drug export protein [Clostridia bacterium]|nr:small multi-drug export protein [Clostridia bacterium]
MTEAIITYFRELTGNDYLTLFIISIIPIIELRGAIIFMSGMDVNMVAGMLCCVAGSSLMIVPLILAIRPIIHALKRSKVFGKLGKELEDMLNDRAPDVSKDDSQAKKKMSADSKKFWGVLVFVALPFPMTGSWSGSAIASILDFKLWKAALSVFIGNILAGAILTLIVAFVPEGYTDFVLYAFIALAIAIFLGIYLTRFAKREKKLQEGKEKHGGRSEYELHELQKEADRKGEALIKREYIDDDGNKHIVVGKDEDRNKRAVSSDDEI